MAQAVADLGYGGFAYLRQEQGFKPDPAEILLNALTASQLEIRVLESLPWLAWEYYRLEWEDLIAASLASKLQNRLGFVVTLARRIAEREGPAEAVGTLQHAEGVLRMHRLPEEDTLCHEDMTNAERTWLRERRPEDALEWNLLTDFTAETIRLWKIPDSSR